MSGKVTKGVRALLERFLVAKIPRPARLVDSNRQESALRHNKAPTDRLMSGLCRETVRRQAQRDTHDCLKRMASALTLIFQTGRDGSDTSGRCLEQPFQVHSGS
jgi:hypothetical protein